MHRTKVDQELADAEEMHNADDPERAELLARARRFKNSWIELAEALTETRKNGAWKRWGYESFEDYAKKELHLRQETVDKLTGSFVFLQKRAPEVLRRDGLTSSIPSYQSVDFLRRAESQEDAPRDVVDQIRTRVIEDAAPHSNVVKQFADTVFPIDHAEKKKRDAAGLRNVGTRLRELLSETHAVPKTLAREVSAALDQLLEALAKVEERAA
ncbi:MAG: hypothetical protein ABI183_02955 [Polyangiaceae bacterium]